MENKKDEYENVELCTEADSFELLYKKENEIRCLQCGRCTASCPAAKVFSDYNPREIVRRALDDGIEELAKDPVIWRCGQCYTCNSRCPRNNNAASIIREARDIAYKEGYASSDTYEKSFALLQSLFSKGVTVSPELLQQSQSSLNKLTDLNKLMELRAALGLPLLDSREVAIPAEAMKEIRTILRKTCNKGGIFNDH